MGSRISEVTINIIYLIQAHARSQYQNTVFFKIPSEHLQIPKKLAQYFEPACFSSSAGALGGESPFRPPLYSGARNACDISIATVQPKSPIAVLDDSIGYS